MSTHSPGYLLLLIAFCVVYWLVKKNTVRKILLLLASYLFYLAFDVRFLLVLLAITCISYVLGRTIPGSSRARLLTGTGVIANFAALAYFKYAGFFLDNAGFLLRDTNFNLPTALHILLPIGISFYTFQAVAYILEVSRGKIEPTLDIIDFGLYLAFFPKLVAGPFVRPREFFQHLSRIPQTISRPEICSALQLLLSGLFKKIVIADSLAILADIAFRAATYPNPRSFPAPLFISGFYLYAMQIYADFSGYTDIARGSAALLGIPLPENFRQPYFSISPGDFWNRWHITLTAWFREYVFFPLSRWGMIKTQRRHARVIQIVTTLTTMILVGFWHGAAWTYVLWGAWHGLLVVIDRLLNLRPTRLWQKISMALVNFHLIGIGWILFRADSIGDFGHFLQGMFSFQQTMWFAHFIPPALLAVLLVFAIDASDFLSPRISRHTSTLRPVFTTAACIVIAALWILLSFSQASALPFIYGSF